MVDPILNLKDKHLPKEPPKKEEVQIGIRKGEEKKPADSKKHTEISWGIPPLHEHEGIFRLRIIAGIIFILALVLMFIFKEYTFSIFLMVLAVTAVILRNKNPQVRHITIHNYGITINDRLHPYREIKSFYVVYEPRGLKELSIQAKNWYLPIIRIPIEPGNSPLTIRNHLIEYLPEVEHPLTPIDVFIRRLGI